MKTAPAETASSNSGAIDPTIVASPGKFKEPAVVMKTRYVGALSRKLDKVPVAQKSCQSSTRPRDAPLAFNIANAGIIVMNIPINNVATSITVSYTHLRAHETRHDLVCRLLL